AAPVGGVEGVDVDVAAVRVERAAAPRRVVPVDRLAVVAEDAEEVVEPPVGPVEIDRQGRELAAPVRQAELPLPVLRAGGRDAVIRQEPLPALDGPIGAVGRPAAGDEPRERGAVVRAARVPEPPADVVADAAPAAGIVEAELDLRARPRRRARVDRAPREDVPEPVAGAVGEQRLASAVDLEAD